MRKAKKKLHQMPKLSFVDKLIYMTILLILILLWVGAFLLLFLVRQKIAVADGDVVAIHAHASLFWFFPGWLCFFLMTFILWLIPYESRRPIFGIRGFRYGPPAWPKIYPVFMKSKPVVWVSQKQKQRKKEYALVLLVVFLLCCLPLPMAFCGRDVLRSDSSISKFNAFNRETAAYTLTDVETLEIYTHGSGGKNQRTRAAVSVELTMADGKHYIFSHKDFLSGESEDVRLWLAEMVALKANISPHRVTVTVKTRFPLERIISDQNLTEQETALLYQLFY